MLLIDVLEVSELADVNALYKVCPLQAPPWQGRGLYLSQVNNGRVSLSWQDNQQLEAFTAPCWTLY